jgi:hypothetical protein
VLVFVTTQWDFCVVGVSKKTAHAT